MPKGSADFEQKHFILPPSTLEGSEACHSDEARYRTELVSEEFISNIQAQL